MFIKFDDNQNIISEIPKEKQTLERKIKNKIYSLGWFLRDHTLTFRIMYLISDKTEEIKNYLKLKLKASKSLNKSLQEKGKPMQCRHFNQENKTKGK